MRYGSAALCGLVLAGCMASETPTPPPSDADQCGAEARQHLIGQDRAAFDESSVDGPVRVLPPGSAMTMDYRRERLNVELGEDGSITRIWCG